MKRHHTDREYAAELLGVRENLLRMAGLVEQMIEDAVRALNAGDQRAASTTIELDLQVNRLEVETDEACLLMLAKRQPVARDLRFITLAMKMVTDLERIGDLGVNISERVLALDAPPPPAIAEKLAEMGRRVQSMVREAIGAFVTRDIEQAESIFELDQAVDDLYRLVSERLQQKMFEEPEFVEPGIHLKAVTKFLERIGDHATNLAELAVFLLKGEDVRHAGKLAAANDKEPETS